MRRLLAVLGRDVSASLSPYLHQAAATQLGLDVAYVPISCPTDQHFRAAVQALHCIGALGANITIPYKSLALALATEASTEAHTVDAVNVLTFGSDHALRGDNTDAQALVSLFEGLPDSVRLLRRVQILGSGGAARAAAHARRLVGAHEVFVTARRGGERCAEIAAGQSGPLGPVVGATLVISSLPGDPLLAQQALDEWIDGDAAPYVLDLAYGGARASPLTLLAQARAWPAQDGLEMLVGQAARSLSIWTGEAVSRILPVMRAAAASTRSLQ